MNKKDYLDKCIECGAVFDDENKFCPYCGAKREKWWESMSIEEFLKRILGKQYIKDAYWNDDYAGFTDVYGNSYYCGYESGWKLEINDIKIIGITSTLKYYEQFAPKEAVEYHLGSFDFYRKLFAGLAVVIQLNQKIK